MSDNDLKAKDEMEKDKIKEMLSEAEKSALDIIEQKYPKHIATEFIVDLPVGMRTSDDALFEGALITRITVRRPNRSERRKSTNKILTSAGKYSNMDIAEDKLMNLITKIESANTHWDWNEVPVIMRKTFLENMDIIDEDEIIEAMAALEYGFGDFKAFYASQAFKMLKEQSDQSFRGDSEEI